LLQQEPSLFAAAKLLETGVVNLNRVQVLWRPVTSHLLEVSAHAHPKMREYGVEAITYLVQNALHYPFDPPLKANQVRFWLGKSDSKKNRGPDFDFYI
jgi:hypothetical protein